MYLRQLADEVLAEARRDNEPEAEPALGSRPANEDWAGHSLGLQESHDFDPGGNGSPVRRSYLENPTHGHPALGLEGRSPVRRGYPENPTHDHPALGVEGRSPVLRSYPENPNEEDHPVVGRGVGSDDPNLEWSDHLRYAAPVNDWRDMFSEQITRILICLGTASGEALRLRESAGRLRYRVASTYARLRPQVTKNS